MSYYTEHSQTEPNDSVDIADAKEQFAGSVNEHLKNSQDQGGDKMDSDDHIQDKGEAKDRMGVEELIRIL